MAIRIERNNEGNCINFHGSSNPTYWNSCLSAAVDSTVTDTVNVINDIITAQTGVTEYEFFQIPYTEFVDAQGNAFATAQDAADYITANANVIGVGGGGTDLTGVEVCFKLDDTSTSVMLDNGYSYGVNTIKAIADTDGTIHIKSKLGDITYFTGLETGNVCDGEGNTIQGGLNDVNNWLNELFTVGAFESVVISDPFSTMVADTGGTAAGYSLVGSTAIDPIGDAIFTNSSSGNYAGLLSTATIDQAGEYFTFDIRGEGQIGFGLVHTTDSFNDGYYSGSSTYADPATFAVGNSAHYGFQFSHWFHPTPNGSWTNYGANTSYSMQSGWSNWESRDEWLAGTPVKIKVGITAEGYIEIASLQDDGTTWVRHVRTSYPVADGAEFKLGIKTANASASVWSAPKVHLLEPAAPTMNFRWIESPDGTFVYPLFATAEEAEYYDEITNGLTAGTGSSHTHTYADDPTNTTWYMPEATHDASTYHHTAAPSGGTFSGNAINWTTITSLTNADLTPAAFSGSDYTYQEGTVVNLQLYPAGATFTQSVTISPAGSGLVYNTTSGYLQGTLADVTADTTYTVTVTRANSYGSTVGTFDITATDVAPTQTQTTAWTKAVDFSGSSERLSQVSTSVYANPLMMSGSTAVHSAWVANGNTHSASNARPWAVATVFQIDGNSSNQHIWNQGEGAGSTDDNIYLRVDSSRRLYFGWGRQGALNELYITTLSTSVWYGVYVAHTGVRLSGSDATAANLADQFDVRIATSSNGFSNLGGNLSTQANWGNSLSSTGARMDRTYLGNFTIGGRGGNRNFHGKVAACVVRTLKNNTAMPNATEVLEMITDPIQWQDDYLVGNTYRPANSGTNLTNYQIGQGQAIYAAQIWLMGDGTNDSFVNGIRNQADPNDTSYTKLNFNSMVSGDIENVNINGLT